MNIELILNKLGEYQDWLIRNKKLDGYKIFSVYIKFFQDKSGAVLIELSPISQDPVDNLIKVAESVDNMTESIVFSNISELLDILERTRPSLN